MVRKVLGAVRIDLVGGTRRPPMELWQRPAGDTAPPAPRALGRASAKRPSSLDGGVFVDLIPG